METPDPPALGVIPTVDPDGRTLSHRERLATAVRHPAFGRAVLVDGSTEQAEYRRMQHLAADEAEPMPPEPATSGRYEIPYGLAGLPDTAEARAFDASARGWLSAAGFDSSTGTHLAEHVAGLVGRQWDGDTLNDHARRSQELLRRAWGADYEANADLVADFVAAIEVEAPGVADFIEQHPYVLRDPITAQFLLGQGQLRRVGR